MDSLAPPSTTLPALDIEGLTVTLPGGAPIIDAVSLAVQPGRTLALVGESGSGKSVTALAAMGLLAPTLRVTGSIRLAGQEMQPATPERWRRARGHHAAMIFQDPVSALDPVLTIGDQLIEAVRVHARLTRRAAREHAIALLARARFPDPARRMHAYPHQLSGGLCQRAMIAMALAGRPRLLIADEPTTALDVTVQAQILELLTRLQHEEGMAMLLITHDLGLVAGYADDVAVMYAGRLVEQAPTDALFSHPRHPYTDTLLRAAPHLTFGAPTTTRFAEIPGHVPHPGAWPPGCGFAPRCPRAQPPCNAAPPPLVGRLHRHACLLEPAA